MKIKTCLFDMGNVLVHFSHERMCQNVANICNVSTTAATDLLITTGLQFQLERGEISENEFHQKVESHLATTVGFEDLMHACADIFWLNESIVPLLDELKRLGIRLVLLSNTSHNHLKFIEKNFDVLSRFDDLTTSFDVGALKPDSAIYRDALVRGACPAENCFYTDDIEAYVTVARQHGIHAFTYTDTLKTRTALRELGVDVSET